MKLCASHGAEWAAWLDYRLPPAPISLMATAGYDLTAAGVRDRREARVRQWRDTITTQQGLVRDACVRECGVPG